MADGWAVRKQAVTERRLSDRFGEMEADSLAGVN